MIFKIRKSSGWPVSFFPADRQDALLWAQGIVLLALIGKLFYNTWLAALLLAPLLVPYIRRGRKARREKEMRALGLQFKDMILSVSASQRAGYSVENAFAEARGDMAGMYGENAVIVRELGAIVKGVANGRTLEDMLASFAKRSSHPDIMEFAEVFRIAKRNGGNMTQMIADTVQVIGDKAEAERQIDVVTSAKRMEGRLMEAVPLLIIAYVGFTNPGFFLPLYGNITGIAIMTVALGVYIAAYFLMETMITIEV